MDPATIQGYLRQLPSVDELLQDPGLQAETAGLPRWAVLEATREALAACRREALACQSEAQLAEALAPPPRLRGIVARLARKKAGPSLRPVINATGVILHTNLGRAPLAAEAVGRVADAARGYAALEYDLAAGSRGSRQAHVEGLLVRLTGAEAALAVNNNAAAVLLAINTLADGREVVVSRGQLVEIGDAFRIPDVMRKAGGILREVGTTNRTHLRDYEEAIGPQTALLLKVHPSNFRTVGFTADVPLRDLVALARRHDLPVMEDLGSGALADLERLGLPREPLVAESVRAGADLVTFSGDKLLGGPQAGLLVGQRACLDRLRRNPLHRAVRIDKLSLAALEATLRLYLDEDLKAIPVLRMLLLPAADVAARARTLADRLRAAGSRLTLTVEEGTSEVGGGALPLEAIPTALLAIRADGVPAEALEARLRAHEPPILGRIQDDKLLLDLRTVHPEETDALTHGLLALEARRQSA